MAMQNLQGAAGGSAGMQALINRTGAQFRGGASGQIPGWVIVGGLAAAAAVFYFGFIQPRGGLRGVLGTGPRGARSRRY
jgi:hypothetical protein